ncbi:MAG: CoA transferase [Dehalococcoidales bacterium]|nr:CoA transferase [Dehalococcoidales bacterium]
MEKKLLEGIRVVDLTWHLTGPLTTKHLSDLGAEVIIVESNRRPGWRRGAPRSGSPDQYCTSKLSITINTREPGGLDLVKQLVAQSDIVIENFAGGAIKRMGLGYEVLKEIKPDIIMLSTSMQGQTGPHSSHPGSGHKLTALAGFSNILGWPDREPGWIAAYTDFIAPRYNILAIMAALDYRRRTGKGQYIDMSQYENGIQFMAPLVLDYAVNKRTASRMGNQSSYAAPHNAYRCIGEDRWCAIAVSTDEEWRSFCEVVDDPSLAKDPRFSTLSARKENEEELDRLVNKWTSSRSAEEVMNVMQAGGIAAGVVETGEDLMDKDPQLKHRNFFHELEYPGIGKYRTHSGAHFLLSKYEYKLSVAPLMGEDNDYVFKEILGMDADEYSKLIQQGVID